MKKMMMLAVATLLCAAAYAGSGISIPDKAFKKYCLQQFDADRDGQISEAEALAVTTMKVGNKRIASLEGIGNFKNLVYLDCSRNDLKELDLSACTELKTVLCYDNKLTALNVNNCDQLEKLNCSRNMLDSLNITHCTYLTHLECWRNYLVALDVTHCWDLWYLDCSKNKIEELDMWNCRDILYLRCAYNYIRVLDLSNAKYDLIELSSPAWAVYLKGGKLASTRVDKVLPVERLNGYPALYPSNNSGDAYVTAYKRVDW